MERIRKLFETAPAYIPVNTNADGEDQDEGLSQVSDENEVSQFSRLEYLIFLLLGMAMLWAWNMFLAAAPYFQDRFQSNAWILNHFQAAVSTISSVVNLGGMTILSKLQKNASYPFRIWTALAINAVCFTFLAISTLFEATASTYFGFLLVMICFASMSTALIQNGLFAFAAGFARPQYIQGIMTGQAVAGILPPLAQILTVIAVPKHDDSTGASLQSHKSAFIYFITATGVSVLALLAFFHLLHRQVQAEATAPLKYNGSNEPTEDNDHLAQSFHSVLSIDRKPVGLLALFRKLPYLTAGVFVTFAGTMLGFPVFTASILSVSHIDPAIFIPASFLVWNMGDLIGRLITIFPRFQLTHWPFALFSISMARLVFVPMYLLCNVKGKGAVVQSDAFYLLIVQVLYGASNGYVGSSCMMGAAEWVGPEEREAAGGFMGLALVSGLTAGSLLSFALGDV